MKLYSDQQDDTRFLEVVEEKGKNNIAKIYFNVARRDEPRRLNYSGKVTLGSHLFLDSFTGTWRDRSAFVAC